MSEQKQVSLAAYFRETDLLSRVASWSGTAIRAATLVGPQKFKTLRTALMYILNDSLGT